MTAGRAKFSCLLSHKPAISPDFSSASVCAQPLGGQVPSVCMCHVFTFPSCRFWPRASFPSPGNFLVQIPFDSNSESVSCWDPGLQSCYA